MNYKFLNKINISYFIPGLYTSYKIGSRPVAVEIHSEMQALRQKRKLVQLNF